MKKLFSFLLIVVLIACSKDPVIYTLTATANPAEGGTVSPSSQQYDSGDVATVTATASSEYVFQSWSGSASGSSPSTTVTMDSDKAVVANFIKKKYALTINVEGEGSVTEKVIKAGLATDYNSGTIVELTAVPEGEWLFVEWKGDLTGSENPKQITIDKAKTVTAVFVKKQYPLTIEIEGEGTVTETVIKQGLATDYNSGTIVELTAEPTGDWEFVEWTGDITSTENPVQITIDGPKTVKVKFENMNLSYKKSVMTMDVENIYLFDRSLFIVSGALSYNISDINYILYPGQANWNAGQQSGPKEEIPAQPSYLFYQDENGYWNFKEKYDDVGIIAGVATAGIPQGALVAENLNLPFAYVRSKPKNHGMKNMIEGRIEKGKRVLLIEDLISTGGSSIKSVEAVRETGSIVIGVLSIFNYGFKVSEENFKNINCNTSSIFNYNDLLSIALKNNYIEDQDLEKLKSWRDNPEKWK